MQRHNRRWLTGPAKRKIRWRELSSSEKKGSMAAVIWKVQVKRRWHKIAAYRTRIQIQEHSTWAEWVAITISSPNIKVTSQTLVPITLTLTWVIILEIMADNTIQQVNHLQICQVWEGRDAHQWEGNIKVEAAPEDMTTIHKVLLMITLLNIKIGTKWREVMATTTSMTKVTITMAISNQKAWVEEWEVQDQRITSWGSNTHTANADQVTKTGIILFHMICLEVESTILPESMLKCKICLVAQPGMTWLLEDILKPLAWPRSLAASPATL